MLMERRSQHPSLQNLRLYEHCYVVNTVEHPVSDYPKCEELVVAYKSQTAGGTVRYFT